MAFWQNPLYRRVKEENDCEVTGCIHLGYYRANLTLLRWSFFMNFVLALVVVGLGVSLSLHYHQSSVRPPNYEIESGRLLEDQYGVSAKIARPYEFFERGFDDDDFRKGDPFWAGLFPKGNGLVFLSDEMVQSYRLPPSAKQAERGNRSAYEVAGYHSLHCLSRVREVIGKFHRVQDTSQPYAMNASTWLHLKHCLADARQTLLCNFDETLLAAHSLTHPGKHQVKLCKDLNPINKWLEDHYIPLE